MAQQMTRMDAVKVGDTIYKEGVFWTVTAVRGPSADGQHGITADLCEDTDLSTAHIPVGYRKGMTFGGWKDTLFSVCLK